MPEVETRMAVSDTATRRSALWVASIGSFLMPFMASSLNIAIPTIGKELKVDAILLSWIPTAYLLSAAVFLLPFGRLADIHGRKKIFILGALIFAAASLACALAGSAEMLVGLRAVQGMGGSMLIGTGPAIITAVFPPGERGKALGINISAVYLGLSVGPFAGGVLTHNLGWRSIFFLNVPIGLAMAAAIALFLKSEWYEATGEKFDLPGSMVYGVSVVLLLYGLSRLRALQGLYLLMGGLAGLALFVWRELRVESPVLDLKLFTQNRVFAFSNIATSFNYVATAGVGFLLSLYLQYIKKFNPEEAGLILILLFGVQAVFAPLAGRLSDRVQPRVVASAGMALTTLGLALFALVNMASSLGYILSGLFFLGTGSGLFVSPNTNAVMSSVDKKLYGVAAGTMGTMRLLGQMLSMGIATLVFSVYIGRFQITPEHYSDFIQGVRAAFSVFAILCFTGIFASLARGSIAIAPPNSNG